MEEPQARVVDRMKDWDVIVVGGGNAAYCAALAAREKGASVLMLEAAPDEESGGNSRFTAGAMRVVYNGVDDIKALVPDLSQAEIDSTDFGTYTQDQFFDDMARVTQFRTDPNLCELLVTRSFDALNWMRQKGIRFVPIYGRQAFKIDGRFKFWGGLTVETVGGGEGLVAMMKESGKKHGIEMRYRTRATDLVYDGAKVSGVRYRSGTETGIINGRAVVLACGGFEANAEWRTRYLGPGWDLAKVRGSRFNAGDGLRMALAIGASPYGNWSGCHAVQWEMNAPEFGDLAVGDQFQKHSYPFAILVNATGKRFVDEGADFRNYTYAKYGRVVLRAAGTVRLADLGPEDQASAARRIQHQAVHQGHGEHDRGTGEEARRREPRAIRQDHRRIQRRRAHRHRLQSQHQGRAAHAGARGSEIELGQHDRQAALRRLRGHLRRHLHLRRLAHQQRRPGDGPRPRADRRSLCRGRAGGRHLLLQLSGRHGSHLGLGVRQDRRSICRHSREIVMAAAAPNELSACDIVRGVREGALTAEAVTRACLDRIAARENAVKAWAFIDPELALRQARDRDRAKLKGPLHGLPIGVKDIFDTHDMPTDMGSPIYRGNRPAADASCVALVRAAGAVILGKTITCEFAGLTPNVTRNPHDPARTPGGSSSGSAAAVADRMVHVAFGTQTGGSVLGRRPSAASSATSRPTTSSAAAA